MEDVMIQYIAKNDEHMKFMETQLSTMKDLLSQRAPKTLPSQIEVNPKNEEFNVVSTSIVYFLHGMCKCITHWAFSSSMSLPHLPQEGGDSVEARTYVCTLIIVSIYLVGIWSFCSMPELDASTSTCFTNLLTILLSL